MQQSELSAATLSGISNVPDIISYPKISNFADIKTELKNQFVYIIEAYDEDGLSVVIFRQNDEVFVKIGDFDGNVIDLSVDNHKFYSQALNFIKNDLPNFVSVMKTLGINKILLYISINKDDIILVDMRVSLDKFYGPGMIKDIFSKVYQTQQIIKTATLTDDIIESIHNNNGSFEGNLIIKCSKFKTFARNKELLPLYAKIIRD